MNEQIRDEIFGLIVMAEMFGWEYKIDEKETRVSITMVKNMKMLSIIVFNNGECYAKTIGIQRFEMKDNYTEVLQRLYKMI